MSDNQSCPYFDFVLPNFIFWNIPANAVKIGVPLKNQRPGYPQSGWERKTMFPSATTSTSGARKPPEPLNAYYQLKIKMSVPITQAQEKEGVSELGTKSQKKFWSFFEVFP